MTTTPAPTDLDTLKALLDAMPEGPWRVAQSQPHPGIRTAAGWEVVWATYADTGPKVLEFIAAARNALPALLDELAKTRRERDERQRTLIQTAGWQAEAERNRDHWKEQYDEQLAATRQLDDMRMREIGEVRRERDAAREELAKTRAELQTARLELATVTESADEATRQADGRRDEIDRLRAEQGTATTPRTYRDMPVYPCGKVGRGIAHMAHVYGVGKAEVACNGLLPHPVPLASPATTAEPADWDDVHLPSQGRVVAHGVLTVTRTAEPADEPKAELCSDKNGFHDGHDWRPDPSGGIEWCPGYPVPAAS